MASKTNCIRRCNTRWTILEVASLCLVQLLFTAIRRLVLIVISFRLAVIGISRFVLIVISLRLALIGIVLRLILSIFVI